MQPETAFARALLRPEAQPPTGSARRFAVYRNNVTVSLIEALGATYPAVRRLTGEDFFRAMARFHIRETPPTSPLLFEYGRDFPAFIDGYPHAKALPWLGDVARIERAWLDAYHAADCVPLSPEAFAATPSDRLGDLLLTPHPATRVLRSRFAAVTIFAAHREPGEPPPIDADVAEDALVTRPDVDVEVRRLAPGEAEFLLALISGAPLGEAAGAAMQTDSRFDLSAALATLIESGAFSSCEIGGVSS